MYPAWHRCPGICGGCSRNLIPSLSYFTTTFAVIFGWIEQKYS